MQEHTYIAIDLKSFYASVECVERGLDALNTNLVVADQSRTNKTICLAVSPSLKSYGIGGRPRLFEVEQAVERINRKRRENAPGGKLKEASVFQNELINDPSLKVDYIVAIPRMAFYMEYSTRIYHIYLRYIAPEDIHVYSIDEVFMDVTHYLKTYGMSAEELAMTMIRDVLRETKITATAGIGTNLYLAKVAMDIVAKHIPADENGVRIASLDEMSYRRKLWAHEPITDFWRVGRGYAKRLAEYGLKTMGDIARYSLDHEDNLYREFGINAELLIDHAWGVEPCTMKDIKAYEPEYHSLGNGQVLSEAYSFEKGKVILKEMAESLSLQLVEKGLVTDSVGLAINYDSADLRDYSGEIKNDWYGRKAPKPLSAHVNLKKPTASTRLITEALLDIYEKKVQRYLKIRRINIVAGNTMKKETAAAEKTIEQIDLFADIERKEAEEEKEKAYLEKEERLQKALLEIKNRYGKNSVLSGKNYEEGATGRERNDQIGGHRK